MLTDGAGRKAGAESWICPARRFLARLKWHGALRFLNIQHIVLYTSVTVGLTVQAMHDAALGLSDS